MSNLSPLLKAKEEIETLTVKEVCKHENISKYNFFGFPFTRCDDCGYQNPPFPPKRI